MVTYGLEIRRGGLNFRRHNGPNSSFLPRLYQLILAMLSLLRLLQPPLYPGTALYDAAVSIATFKEATSPEYTNKEAKVGRTV